MAEARVVFNSLKAERFYKTILKNGVDISQAEEEYVNAISAIVFRDIINHFKREEGPDGKWAPWSSSYIAAIQGRVAFRKINGRIVPLGPYAVEEYGIKPPREPGQILQNSGRLRQSFEPTLYRFRNNGIEWLNPARTKSGFPYAAHHDSGPSDGKNPRPFMWLSDKALDKIGTVTLGFIMRNV